MTGPRSVRLTREKSLRPSIFVAFVALSVAALAAQLVNLRVASPGLFIVGVLYLLGTAGLEFFRLVQVEAPAVQQGDEDGR